MAKIIKLNGGPFHHAFQCPGCGRLHGIDDRWTWNGDVERPTILPSILVRGTKLTEKGEAQYKGMIQFLNDCTHELAGQTVPLKEV